MGPTATTLKRPSEAAERVSRACRLAVDLSTSPRLRTDDVDRIGDVMFSNQKVEKFDDREPEVLLPLKENPRLQSNERKSRSGLDEQGNPLPGYSRAACEPLTGNSLDHRVRWGPSAELPAGSTPIRLRFIMKNASVYSFMAGARVRVLDDSP